MKIRSKKAAIVTMLGAGLLLAAGAQAQQFKIMSGPQGGSWYPLAGAIANIDKGMGIALQVLPGAGIANVQAVQAGKADMGFGNSISTADGIAGRPPFKEKTSNVCNIASLYPQYFQIVANADSGIKSVADLKGKSIAVQPRGNTAEFITTQMLQVYGLTYKDMARVSNVSYTDAVSLLKDNNAQAFTLGTQVPGSSIMDLAASRAITLIPVPDDKFQEMRALNPAYTKLTIKAGSYPGQNEDVQAVGYATHLIARCDLSTDVVYKTLKGIVDHQKELAIITKDMGNTTLKMMAEDIGVPLHKGAEQYYKEKGVL